MATVKFSVRGKGEFSQITLRYVNSKIIDERVGINIYVNPIYWDEKKQRIKNVLAVPDRDEINEKLGKLALFVLGKGNTDYSNSEDLNKLWLERTIAAFFKRPDGELKKAPEPHKIYLSDFATFWLEEKAPLHKVSATKRMSQRTIRQYKSSGIEPLKKYEAQRTDADGNKLGKIRLKDISNEILDNFSEFLTSEGYAMATTQKIIVRIKFFCKRADAMNFEVSRGYVDRVFAAPTPDEEKTNYMAPYLPYKEIDDVYNLNLKGFKRLDLARDNWIVGLWTGLRVSDFLTRLNYDNIIDGIIEIKTQKIGNWVAIPIHPMVEAVIAKYNGQLPPNMNEVEFNRHIKVIAKKAGLTQKMMGAVNKVVDEKTGKRRKVIGLYEKWELVGSHICRKSFATNLYMDRALDVKKETIMVICGWSSEQQMLDYIKVTNREHAEILGEKWREKYNKVVQLKAS